MHITHAASDSDVDIARGLAEAAAQHICWLVDTATFERDTLKLTGWALLTKGGPEDAWFLVNGVRCTTVRFPLESPGLDEHFYDVANSKAARFECEIETARLPPTQDLRLELVQNNHRIKARRTAWWVPVHALGDGTLTDERISRVVGSSDRFSFEMGGATLFHRIEDYLWRRFGRRYRNMDAILDWGCGAGRLLSRFADVQGPRVWGADVDVDNLKFCQEQYPFAQCVVLPLTPPVDLPDGTFDLIVGVSVCTHLSEAHQRTMAGRIAPPVSSWRHRVALGARSESVGALP